MKLRLIFPLLFTLLVSAPASAAGPYDGLYKIVGLTMYATVHQNGSQLIVGFLDYAVGDWDAMRGLMSGNTASLEVIYTASDGGVAEADIEFDGNHGAVLTFTSCTPTPGHVCLIEPGYQMELKKIF